MVNKSIANNNIKATEENNRRLNGNKVTFTGAYKVDTIREGTYRLFRKKQCYFMWSIIKKKNYTDLPRSVGLYNIV